MERSECFGHATDTTPVPSRGAVRDTHNLLSDQIRTVVKEACALKAWARAEPSFRREHDRVVDQYGMFAFVLDSA
jgi:hypothetical protein